MRKLILTVAMYALKVNVAIIATVKINFLIICMYF